MEEQGYKLVRAFDSAFTTEKLQMMKILCAHLPSDSRGLFAIIIKLMELTHTLSLLNSPCGFFYATDTAPLTADFFSGENEGTLELLDELLPFSSAAERERISQMKNMMQSMKQMKDMMDMVQMMREMFPEGTGGDGGNGDFNPTDIFSAMNGMGSSDGFNPMDLFSAFGNMGNSAPTDT